jgi:hypothetical protein
MHVHINAARGILDYLFSLYPSTLNGFVLLQQLRIQVGKLQMRHFPLCFFIFTTQSCALCLAAQYTTVHRADYSAAMTHQNLKGKTSSNPTQSILQGVPPYPHPQQMSLVSTKWTAAGSLKRTAAPDPTEADSDTLLISLARIISASTPCEKVHLQTT